MYIKKTVDSPSLLRLEEGEGGASVTIKKNRSDAQILSILVPESDRREGIGTALLSVSESLLTDEGFTRLYVDFIDSIEGMTELFENSGYELKKEAPVISLDIPSLLKQKIVSSIINQASKDVIFEHLSDVPVNRIDEVLDRLSKIGIELGNADIARLDKTFSGIVSKMGQLKALILCSSSDSRLHVDFLTSFSPDDPIYVVTAIGGMLNSVIDAGKENCQKLTLIAGNDSVNALLSHLAKKSSIEMQTECNVMMASKELKDQKPVAQDIEIEDVPDEDMAEEWKREIRKVAYQRNISWKMPWNRRNSGEASEGNETQDKETPGQERRITHIKKQPVYIPYDKDEDETEGLIKASTLRITEDNLSEYKGLLPPDISLNLQRPFFKGLAIKNEESPDASLVWEYKDPEDDNDTDAEIFFISSKNNDALETLIEEYTNELKTRDTVTSFFELKGLTGDQQKLLTSAGFAVKEGEGRDLCIPLSELSKCGVVSKAPASFVQNLASIDDRQYKRGVTNALFHKKKGILEDLVFLPKAWFDEDVSACVIADSKVTGMLLVHLTGDSKLIIDLLFSVGAEYKIEIIQMMRFALDRAMGKYPQDTEVILRRHNKETEALTEKLFPGAHGDTVAIGERREN